MHQSTQRNLQIACAGIDTHYAWLYMLDSFLSLFTPSLFLCLLLSLHPFFSSTLPPSLLPSPPFFLLPKHGTGTPMAWSPLLAIGLYPSCPSHLLVMVKYPIA